MKKRILFVDDEPSVLQGLQRMLRLLHDEWEMTFAGSGAEALDLLTQSPFDVIVSDMRMPGMDGAELLAFVCRHYPDTGRIALTGHATLKAAVRAINEGEISRFLLKPCNEADLTLAVEHALRRKEQERTQFAATLARVGREMISSFDTSVLLDRLCQLTTEVLECERSHTFLWQPKEDAYIPAAGYGDTPEQWEALRVLKIPRPTVTSLLTHLQRDDVVQVGTATQQDLRPEALPMQYDNTACLYLALRRGDEIWGIHTAGYPSCGKLFTTQQERLARGMVQIASMALQNARLVSELEGANHLKEEFLATMSHELRTPLNIIIGYNDLLLEREFGPLTVKQAETLRQVMKSSRGLFDLISAMLDVGRLESRRLPVALQEVRIPELISEIEAETQELRKKPGLSFVWKAAPDLPLLRTDPLKLKVIIKNLISNAVKFTDQGSVTVDVHTLDSGVEICVADTGSGIAQETLPIIFEPFRQGDGSMTRCHDGAGLGLYVVQRLLELLGGTITVESEVGHGSAFSVRIPTNRPLTPSSPQWENSGEEAHSVR